MLSQPFLKNTLGQAERLAHGSPTPCDRIEPDRHAKRLFSYSTGSVIHLLRPVLDSGGHIADFTDRDQFFSSERTAECRANGIPISDHTHVEIIPDAFFFSASYD